jgi:hypothetical protein
MAQASVGRFYSMRVVEFDILTQRLISNIKDPFRKYMISATLAVMEFIARINPMDRRSESRVEGRTNQFRATGDQRPERTRPFLLELVTKVKKPGTSFTARVESGYFYS